MIGTVNLKQILIVVYMYRHRLSNHVSSLIPMQSGFETEFICFLQFQRYTCNTSQLPAEIASQFVQLDKDEETIAFLNKSRINSGNICLQLLYTCVQILLSLFFSQTSINGYAVKGRGYN